MSKTFDESSVYKRLRDKAEARLQAGTTPTAGHHLSMNVDALHLLHQLSSDHERAEDALKLLHELQVHQVELDLQSEEIAANEQVLVDDLHLYRALYDSAPLAYFVVDLKGAVIQGNLAAAELFGVGKGHLERQRIDTFLKSYDRPLLLGLLQRVAESGARESCVAETGGAEGSRQLQFLASIHPTREQLLLVCCECGNVE